MISARLAAAVRKLRAFARGADDGPALTEHPPERALPCPPGGVNPIQQMLETAGFPWRDSCQDLIGRFGLVRQSATGQERSPLLPCPLGLDGLLEPISPQIFSDGFRDQVPLWFSGAIRISNDPLANIRHAHRQVAKRLGPAPIGRAGNTVRARWRAGPALVSLTVWPQQLQFPPHSTPAQDRDPRLASACTLFIEPGYRRPMSMQERVWLSGFRPLAALGAAQQLPTLAALWDNAPGGGPQEFLRLPPADQDNFLNQAGLSADGRALIVCAQQLHIIPLARIAAIRLQKILPAKGGGGASLALICTPPPHALAGEREIGLSGTFGEMDALDGLAAALAGALGCPLRVPEPQYDC